MYLLLQVTSAPTVCSLAWIDIVYMYIWIEPGYIFILLIYIIILISIVSSVSCVLVRLICLG